MKNALPSPPPAVVGEWLRFLADWRPARLPDEPGEFVRGLLGYEFTPFHEEWWRFTLEHRFSLLLAPRGHGKSTILTIAFSLYQVLHNPDRRVLLCSNTGAQARAFLREIRSHLESNPALARLLGNLQGRPWTESELTLAHRLYRAKEATFTALGVFGPIIARHYDLIILDDVVDESAASSPLLRDKLHTWYYKELLPTLEPGGELHLIGTRYHQDDLYARLMAAGIPARIERAVIETEAGEQALWEEKFPLARLQQLRAEAGPVIFNAQYQNDVQAMQGCIFRPEWIIVSPAPAPQRKFQGVDLAIGTRDRSDYFAHVTVAEHRPGFFHVLGAYQARLSFEEQFRAICSLFALHDCPEAPVVKIGVEANAYQEALAQRLRSETRLPVLSVVQTRDKITRALRLQSLFETGRISFEPGAAVGLSLPVSSPPSTSLFSLPLSQPLAALPELISQLLSFPDTGHDDLVDALELALRVSLAATRYSELPLSFPDIKP